MFKNKHKEIVETIRNLSIAIGVIAPLSLTLFADQILKTDISRLLSALGFGCLMFALLIAWSFLIKINKKNINEGRESIVKLILAKGSVIAGNPIFLNESHLISSSIKQTSESLKHVREAFHFNERWFLKEFSSLEQILDTVYQFFSVGIVLLTVSALSSIIQDLLF